VHSVISSVSNGCDDQFGSLELQEVGRGSLLKIHETVRESAITDIGVFHYIGLRTVIARECFPTH